MSKERESDLDRALRLSREEAKREEVRRARHAEPWPRLQRLVLSDGQDGMTVAGRSGKWVPLERLEHLVVPSAGRCICIRMTIGSFRGYSERCLLHTGVSTSTGTVFNFDERGHHADAQWHESINVPITHSALSDAEWDTAVKAYDTAHRARRPTYRAIGYNCYNYVVGFLNAIKYRGSAAHTVETMTTELEPAMMPAIRYIKLVQRLEREHVVRLGSTVPVGRHAAHPAHDLFLNSDMSSRYMCDDCGGSDNKRYTCLAGCDFDVCGACFRKHKAPA